MAKQTINIGASPNDGTGTPLRTSFDYCNLNFTELYTAVGPSGNNIVVPGTATITGAVVCNGAVTLGDAVGDAINVTGSFTSYNGQAPSAIRAAASDYAAVSFDGATTSTRIASTITTNPITTGDYTVWSRVRVPTTSIAGQDPLWTLGSAADGSGAYGITARYFTASNSFNIAIRSSVGGSSGGDSASADVTIPFATYTGQVVDLVVVRVASVLTVYLNGTSLAVTYTGTQASFALAPGNFPTNPAQLFGVGASTTVPFRGRIYRSVVFNRALSATDVTELITTGVNPADQWGTQTQIANTTTLNGGFETAGGGGADAFANWVEFTTGTTTITRDTAVFSPNLSSTASANFTADASNSSANITLANTLLASKRFRLSFDFRHNGTAAAGPQYNLGAGSDIVGTAAVPNTWTSYVIEAIAGGTTFAFSRSSGVGATKTSWYDNTILERIGAIVDLDFTVGTGYQATDRSTNALHGTLFNGVEFTQPKRVAVLYATTSTSGNQQMLASTAIPTNAVIEDIIVNSTGTVTVSVGNASAGTQIVNAASVVSGRQKLTLATPFSTTGNLWVNANSTATLQFTILYTVAS